MRLGTRWRSGEEPPPSVPAELRAAIVDVERQAATGGHWTLTWLEGRPVAEFDAGWDVLQGVDGEVVIRPF